METKTSPRKPSDRFRAGPGPDGGAPRLTTGRHSGASGTDPPMNRAVAFSKPGPGRDSGCDGPAAHPSTLTYWGARCPSASSPSGGEMYLKPPQSSSGCILLALSFTGEKTPHLPGTHSPHTSIRWEASSSSPSTAHVWVRSSRVHPQLARLLPPRLTKAISDPRCLYRETGNVSAPASRVTLKGQEKQKPLAPVPAHTE